MAFLDAGDYVIDNWEILDVKNMSERLSSYLEDNFEITFENRILNKIWEFDSEKVGDRLIKYFYNF